MTTPDDARAMFEAMRNQIPGSMDWSLKQKRNCLSVWRSLPGASRGVTFR